MKKTIPFLLQAISNSYSILFFSQNRLFGVLLLLVSFVNPAAGIAGLISLLFSITLVKLMNYDRESIRIGFYSFNSLLLGIGLGTFYHFNGTFFIWLIAGCLLTTMLSVVLLSRLSKLGLPLLSFPFIIVFCVLLQSANSVYYTGLEQRNSAILNEMYSSATGSGYHLKGVLSFITIPDYCGLFFRALSAVLFQNNILTGIAISIGIFIHSRINFSLFVIAFVMACLFNSLTGTYAGGISYYHMGSNIMMTAGAIGSFFLIPSARSYLWAVLTIPVTFLAINAFTRLFGMYDLPVLSLPFAATTILFINFFKLRTKENKLQLTPVQLYSPEQNLYQYLNGRERLYGLKYLSFNLPFMGTWFVSQGYDGKITHKAEWGKALDFVINDDDGRTYQYPGTLPEHFYCFNKPVLACADGTVEEVVTHVDDNKIGDINTIDNWGNSIVIKHANGLYSKVSHLKKHSVKVKTGDFVKQGDLLGSCGNSGRSPEPHLHFQVQTTPYIGSKTISYPIAYFIDQTGDKNKLRSFKIPREGTKLSPVEINAALKKAFKLQPGYTATITTQGHGTEHLEVFTDTLNQTYIYSQTTGASAYFINNGTSFYFTGFYGSQTSLLYYFYLTAYKVIFTTGDAIPVTDLYPVQLLADKLTLWLHDLLAPFRQFIKLRFRSYCTINGNGISINSLQYKEGFGKSKQTMAATLQVEGSSIKGFTININNTKVDATWTAGSIY
ncbi:MAG: urea transporter [Mucilaginibacter sp.]